jgi:ferritin
MHNNFSQEFLDGMRYFLQDHSPERIDKNLRLVFFDYLRNQREGLPIEFDEVLNDIEALFVLIQTMRNEKAVK